MKFQSGSDQFHEQCVEWFPDILTHFPLAALYADKDIVD